MQKGAQVPILKDFIRWRPNLWFEHSLCFSFSPGGERKALEKIWSLLFFVFVFYHSSQFIFQSMKFFPYFISLDCFTGKKKTSLESLPVMHLCAIWDWHLPVPKMWGANIEDTEEGFWLLMPSSCISTFPQPCISTRMGIKAPTVSVVILCLPLSLSLPLSII